MVRVRIVRKDLVPDGCGYIVIRLVEGGVPHEFAGIPEIMCPPPIVGGEPIWVPLDFVYKVGPNPEDKGILHA